MPPAAPLLRRGAVAGVRVVAVASAVVALLTGLLVLAEAVPDEPVVHRLALAVDRGDYGPDYVPDGVGGVHDKFTECVVLGHGLGSPPEPMGVVRRAVWAPRIGSCTVGTDQVRALAAGEQVDAGGYYRYWSGYAVLTRPVIAWLGVPGLRLVVTGLLAAAAAFAGAALTRRVGAPVTAALVLPLVATTNVVTTPGYAFPHAISLAAMAVGVGAVAVAADRWEIRGAGVAAALGAALVNYVDLLTTPAVPWAASAFAAGAVVYARGRGPARVLAAVVTVGAVWPLAFAATWVSRWLVAAAVLGPDVLSSIAEVGRFRVSGQHGDVALEPGAATASNLSYWWQTSATAPVVLAVAAVVAAAALVLAARRHGARGLVVALVLASPLVAVPAVYEVLRNHSQIHEFFTYRSVPVGIGVAVAACVAAASRPRPTRSGASPPRSADA